MAVRTTFHWTHLDYANPGWHKYDTWGPVAEVVIMTKIEILDRPNCDTKNLQGIYKRLSVPIEKGTDPKHQIIQAIKKFGEEEGIQIKYDFVKKWKEKNPDDLWSF